MSVWYPNKHSISVSFQRYRKEFHLGDGRNQAKCHLCKWVELRAKVGSVEERQNGYCTHFRNWANNAHHPLDSTDSPFQCIGSVNRLLSLVGATERNQSLLDRRHLYLVIWHRCASLDEKGICRGQRRFWGGGLNGSPGVWCYRGLSSFSCRSVVSFGRDFGGVGNDRRGHVR